MNEDDDRPKKKITHEIGQELALLSVKELQERIVAPEGGDRAARSRRSPASRRRATSPITFFKK